LVDLDFFPSSGKKDSSTSVSEELVNQWYNPTRNLMMGEQDLSELNQQYDTSLGLMFP